VKESNMNSVNFSKFLATGLVLALGLVGCIPKGPKNPTPIPPLTQPTPGSVQTPIGPTGRNAADPGPGVGFGQNTNVTSNPLLTTGEGTGLAARDDDSKYTADAEMFKEQIVHFKYDSSAVELGEKAKIDTVASFLRSNPTFKLRVEGHCDERGTEEYNRALGERRALSIREVVVAAGIAADRVNTLTFGEDKPAVQGHDEGAWAKNRRGEFVVLKPKTP
jgi:peptidoglycan-associated lipoprotein